MVCHCNTCQFDTIITLIAQQGETLMALQEDLTQVRDNLTEATTELSAKIDQLMQQVADGQVDPALAAEVKSLAQGLADMVPDAPE